MLVSPDLDSPHRSVDPKIGLDSVPALSVGKLAVNNIASGDARWNNIKRAGVWYDASPSLRMKSLFSSVVIAAIAVRSALAVGPYGQCGGSGYSGSNQCDAGYTCTVVNEWYHQCLPGSAGTTAPPTQTTPQPTPTVPTTTSPNAGSSVCPGAVAKFKYFGVNQSGAEFGENVIPGTLGKDYTWPSPSSVDYFVNQGFNTFRIAFKLERLSPLSGGLTGAFDQTYLSGLRTIVNYITNKGAYAVVEPHNYMRYNGQTITDTNAFSTWWGKLANEFKSNNRVIFDIMNEPHTMDAGVVFNLNQAAVNAIRAAGATTQLILVEGTAWTGAWSWTTSSGNSQYFGAIRDPNNNVAIEMHQYLDSDSSGTSPNCVSSTVGRERLSAATNWLKQNNLKGFLGELGAGSNSQCIEAVKGALCSMQESGVWIGALWWAAGPWWGDYFQSIEPPNGAAISQILPQALKPFM